MKIPCRINLDLVNNKSIVNDIIKRDAISKDINQIGLEIKCISPDGLKYNILQFNSSRNIVSFGVDYD